MTDLLQKKCSDSMACSLKTMKMLLFFSFLFAPTVRVSLFSENSNSSVLFCAVYKTVAACSSLHCVTLGRVLHDRVLWMRTACVSTLKWVLHE